MSVLALAPITGYSTWVLWTTTHCSQIARGHTKKELGETVERLGIVQQELGVAKGTIMSLEGIVMNMSARAGTLAAQPAPSAASGTIATLESYGLSLKPNWEYPKAESYSSEKLRHMFWTHSAWRDADNRADEKIPPPGPKGKKRCSEGINVAYWFICDDNGVMVDGYRSQEMVKKTWDFLFTILKTGDATLTWESVGLHIKNAYYTLMKNEFHELAYCNNDWKALAVVSRVYQTFSKNYVKPKLRGAQATIDLNSLQKIEDATAEDLAATGSPERAGPSTGASSLGITGERVGQKCQSSSLLGGIPKSKSAVKKRRLNLQNPYTMAGTPNSSSNAQSADPNANASAHEEGLSTYAQSAGASMNMQEAEPNAHEEDPNANAPSLDPGANAHEDDPDADPNANAPPPLDPNANAPPLLGPNTNSSPLLGPNANAPLLLDPGANAHEDDPDADPNTNAPPLLDPNTNSSPLLGPNAKSSPLLDPNANAPVLLDPNANSSPLLDPNANCLPVDSSKEGGERGGLMGKKPRGKLVQKPNDVKTAKKLFQKEQFDKGNITDAQFRKMWKELSDDLKKEYSERAMALIVAGGDETGKSAGRKKGKESKA
ncbi:hypothetical protein OE88DRAFT_1729819 [Heliocybe sulcata]|uniref:Uncharacterized protein n=1 Tax=Heliocybe sulcata TaxID=5364 RepID=A0A5C3MIE3_9AGAM|nr:hypothetical protein OE88DRAFT_1729819 [Heliocybe sulcata]